MAEGKKVRMKSVRDIFNQARSIAPRIYSRSGQEKVFDTADRYAQAIKDYLGDNYSMDKKVPTSVYMGRQNNR